MRIEQKMNNAIGHAMYHCGGGDDQSIYLAQIDDPALIAEAVCFAGRIGHACSSAPGFASSAELSNERSMVQEYVLRVI